MKKVRSTVVFLVTVLMMLLLSSCNKLDEAKKRQAFWADDTSNVIEWQGRKYLRSDLDPDSAKIRIRGEFVHVTEKDVPVMLSSSEGTQFSSDLDERVLYCEEYFTFQSFTSLSGRQIPCGTLYIREDLMDSMQEALEKSQTDKYCMEFWTPQGEKWLLLSDELTKKLDKALEEGTIYTAKDVYDEKNAEELGRVVSEYTSTVAADRCDESMLIRGDTLVFYALEENGTTKVLVEVTHMNGQEMDYIALKDASVYKSLKEVME